MQSLFYLNTLKYLLKGKNCELKRVQKYVRHIEIHCQTKIINILSLRTILPLKDISNVTFHPPLSTEFPSYLSIFNYPVHYLFSKSNSFSKFPTVEPPSPDLPKKKKKKINKRKRSTNEPTNAFQRVRRFFFLSFSSSFFHRCSPF